METKRCSKCKEVKPITEFFTRRERPSGYQSSCKTCKRVAVLATYPTDYIERRDLVKDGEKRCPGCKTYKPTSQFHERSGRKHGLRDRCIACEKQYATSRKRIVANRELRPKVDEKLCPGCDSVKPACEFNLARFTAHGLQSRCKDCQHERNVLYYEANKDREAKRARAYQSKRRPQKAEDERERRALKVINGGSHTHAEWLALVEHYGGQCLRCGSKHNITKDHVVPVSKGGPNSIDNLQPLCAGCNSSKKDRTIDYRGNIDTANRCV